MDTYKIALIILLATIVTKIQCYSHRLRKDLNPSAAGNPYKLRVHQYQMKQKFRLRSKIPPDYLIPPLKENYGVFNKLNVIKEAIQIQSAPSLKNIQQETQDISKNSSGNVHQDSLPVSSINQQLFTPNLNHSIQHQKQQTVVENLPLKVYVNQVQEYINPVEIVNNLKQNDEKPLNVFVNQVQENLNPEKNVETLNQNEIKQLNVFVNQVQENINPDETVEILNQNDEKPFSFIVNNEPKNIDIIETAKDLNQNDEKPLNAFVNKVQENINPEEAVDISNQNDENSFSFFVNKEQKNIDLIEAADPIETGEYFNQNVEKPLDVFVNQVQENINPEEVLKKLNQNNEKPLNLFVNHVQENINTEETVENVNQNEEKPFTVYLNQVQGNIKPEIVVNLSPNNDQIQKNNNPVAILINFHRNTDEPSNFFVNQVPEEMLNKVPQLSLTSEIASSNTEANTLSNQDADLLKLIDQIKSSAADKDPKEIKPKLIENKPIQIGYKIPMPLGTSLSGTAGILKGHLSRGDKDERLLYEPTPFFGTHNIPPVVPLELANQIRLQSDSYGPAFDPLYKEDFPGFLPVKLSPNHQYIEFPIEMYKTKFDPVPVSDNVYINHQLSVGQKAGHIYPVKGTQRVFGYTRSARFIGNFINH